MLHMAEQDWQLAHHGRGHLHVLLARPWAHVSQLSHVPESGDSCIRLSVCRLKPGVWLMQGVASSDRTNLEIMQCHSAEGGNSAIGKPCWLFSASFPKCYTCQISFHRCSSWKLACLSVVAGVHITLVYWHSVKGTQSQFNDQLQWFVTSQIKSLSGRCDEWCVKGSALNPILGQKFCDLAEKVISWSFPPFALDLFGR